ncbi:hypothetical protein ACIRRH_11765 [Kitasatospora sp. NPDC101235]|uniref:hypothetical protein n=1 Tax=Kitasatospora sp. NPDC101235 TaxID=3364101 RepID=UPI0037F37641
MTEDGRIFREAWIAGVRKHFPGDPKPGYIAPWEDTPPWERASAAAKWQQETGADIFEAIERRV